MKLYEVVVKESRRRRGETLFVMAGSRKSALDISREETGGKPDDLRIENSADADGRIAPRVIARRPAGP